MHFGLIDLLKLLGSLGVFLFGMKLMSEALQKVAGSKLRNILAAMTSSRFKGILAGLMITAIIQSSSATTVMVVSFVNAGLLQLIEAIGMIMGANIGTTVTAWIISIFGFKVNMGFISLPMIGLALPLLFSKRDHLRSMAEVIFGFALLFLGLEYLKGSVPDIRNNPDILSFLANYTDKGLLSYLIFLTLGSLLTIIIQSSSATMALTLVMCNNGWIGFDSAAAMVLGENIGTTITANIAAMIANTSAKRAARAHFVFNVFGVIWMTLVFPLFLKGIAWIITETGAESPFTSAVSVPIALSLFHTLFNIMNVLILVWFAKFIAKTVTRLVRQPEDEEEFKLKFIGTGLLSTAEMSLLQAKKEILSYTDHVIKMFHLFRKQFGEPSKKKFEKRQEKISQYEDASDRTEVEIAEYLGRVAEGELSISGSKRIKSHLGIIDNIESISDCVFNLSKTLGRAHKQKIHFPESLQLRLTEMFDLVDQALDNMKEVLNKHVTEIDLDKTKELERAINKLRNHLRKEHLSNFEKQREYSYMAGVIYTDLFSECEKLGDYVVNVCESYMEIRS